MISCPDCAGVVRAHVVPHGQVQFICTVGHVFSVKELYIAKEMQVEHAQWSVLALLAHLQMIIDTAFDLDGHQSVGFRPHELEQRKEQIRQHIMLVEGVIAETRLPALNEPSDIEEPPLSDDEA